MYSLIVWGSIQPGSWRFYLKNDRGHPNLPKAYHSYNKYSARLLYPVILHLSVGHYLEDHPRTCKDHLHLEAMIHGHLEGVPQPDP